MVTLVCVDAVFGGLILKKNDFTRSHHCQCDTQLAFPPFCSVFHRLSAPASGCTLGLDSLKLQQYGGRVGPYPTVDVCEGDWNDRIFVPRGTEVMALFSEYKYYQ